jgi:hypothetical protein
MAVLIFVLVVFAFAFLGYHLLAGEPQIEQKNTTTSTPIGPGTAADHEKVAAVQMIARSKNSDLNEDAIEYSIVGESNYQQELAEICGGYLKSKEARVEEALLIPEPDNPADMNAVAIKIKNKTVGYIPKTDAKHFQVLLKGTTDGLTCPAEIRGGWKRRDGSQALYGVFLQIKVVQ